MSEVNFFSPANEIMEKGEIPKLKEIELVEN
jgi:hypothetical protein